MDLPVKTFSGLFADYPSLQNGLTVRDGPAPDRRPYRPDQTGPLPDRGPNSQQPPRPQTGNDPRRQPTRHRRQLSEDEENRIRKNMHNPKTDTLNIFGTSPERKERIDVQKSHARRNSETSVMDVKVEERKQSRRDRDRDGKDKMRSKRPNRRVDVIDKLDVTGLYGTGRMLSMFLRYECC